MPRKRAGNVAEDLSVEVLQQEVERIQAWLDSIPLTSPARYTSCSLAHRQDWRGRDPGSAALQSEAYQDFAEDIGEDGYPYLEGQCLEVDELYAAEPVHCHGRDQLAGALSGSLAMASTADTPDMAGSMSSNSVPSRAFFGPEQAEIQALSGELARRRRRVRSLAERAAQLELELNGEPTQADVGAQRDILRLLQRSVTRLKASTERAPKKVAVREDQLRQNRAAEALLLMQSRLGELRQMYLQMGERCLGLEQQMGAQRQETGAQEDLRNGELPMAEEAGLLSGAIADHQRWLTQAEEEVQQLQSEVVEAVKRRDEIQREEAKLMLAAAKDRETLEHLRAQLRRSEAHNKTLESEARALGLRR